MKNSNVTHNFPYRLMAAGRAMPWAAVILATTVALACATVTGPAAKAEQAGSGRLNVLVTTFPIHLITKAVVAGDNGVSVELLLSSTLGCPHDYVLTPADMRRLAKADVVIINGLGLDGFIEGVVGRGRSRSTTVIDSSAGIAQTMNYTPDEEDGDEDHHEGHRDEEHDGHHHEGHHHEGVNPHMFASPLMAARIAANIADRLSAIRPSKSDLYHANAINFGARMKILHNQMATAVLGLRNVRIVTQHGVFDYLARDIGLSIVAVIQSHPGSEPSASQMLALVRKIRGQRAGAIFAEPQYGTNVPATIAREARIPMETLDPVATGPAGAGPEYYEITMRNNILKLEKALGTR